MLLRSLPTSKRATHNVKRLLFITPLYFVHTILSYLSSISTNIHTYSLFSNSLPTYICCCCAVSIAAYLVIFRYTLCTVPLRCYSRHCPGY
ncbi:hypothetical protein J3E68DRAFT_67629 [Trichoderma sp. SZMC 28012]